MKRVYCLYRVSTAQQVDVVKDDIPMQRIACHDFAARMGWTILVEKEEKGISGFKVSAEKRDAIQELKEAALNKEKQEEDPAYTDSRNGYKTKTLRSNYGPVEVNVPQDRKSDYAPKIVPKYGRDISEIDEKIIRMYARGMTTRQISDQIMEIYGFEASEAMVTS